MPKRISRSEAEAWLATNCPRYRILSWPEKAGDKCLFVDDLRGVEFQIKFADLKQKLKNPDYIFCATNSEIRNKTKQTNINKYGTEHHFQSSEIKQKIKQTTLERYGVSNVSLSEDIQKKKIETNLSRRGVRFPTQSHGVKQKVKQTILERYGVKSVFQSEEIRLKIKKTNTDKYGHEYPLKSNDIKLKLANSNLLKYGVENISSLPQVRKKVCDTNISRYGFAQCSKNAEVKQKILKAKVSSGIIRMYDGKFLSDFCRDKGVSHSHVVKLYSKLGDRCVDFVLPHKTHIESIVQDILIKNEINFNTNKKLCQFNLTSRPDFYLPESKLAIECDGLYWHCEKFDDSKKPSAKKKAYSDSGLNSLFFYEDEILNKPQIVESMILNKAGKLSLAFNARDRQLRLQKLAGPECKEFLDANHIMGAGKGAGYCLVDEAGLILACMQIARKGDGISISRFCSRTFCSVRGAFGKLLKFAIADTNPAFVETFIDQRYGTGSYLPSFGFEQKTCYPSFYWTDFESRFHRLNFRGNTGYEAGLVKIWDCGQAKWVKICRNE